MKFLTVIFFIFLFGCSSEESAVKNLAKADYGKGFNLTDHNGKPKSLGDFRGKVVVLFFGYTHCPEVCPTTLSDMAQAMKKLGSAAEKVQVVFVTIDPERDTPELLKKYVPSFDPSFIGLYGNAQETARAAQEFRVYYQKVQVDDNKARYEMDHTAGCFVLDKNGKLQLYLEYGIKPEEIETALRKLL